ncbi:MAG: 3-deoxy-manno-octulosonate cytidylyltransferase [Bacillota bacterium]
MSDQQVVGIIPARYDSTRLPGKPLLEIQGQPMIQHVYKRAEEADILDEVIVATDDLRIKEAVLDFDGRAVMTSADHQTGTDRLAEVAAEIEADLIVNVQGDEPLITSEMITAAVQPLLADQKAVMSTLKHQITDDEEIKNPNLVKVITDQNNNALYFSRSPLPYCRDQEAELDYYKHIGLYVYRREFLLKFAQLAVTPLEKAESLEQLRALEQGYKIKVAETEANPLGVDTAEDLDRVREIMEAMNDE